ncbi:MAG: hypothetical protein KBT33_05010 [Prevotellaceae bacterium]|nr:hypothetical protein [Candidatus Minthosoma equi]
MDILPPEVRAVVEDLLEIIDDSLTQSKLNELLSSSVEWYEGACALFAMCYCNYDREQYSYTIADLAFYQISMQIDYENEYEEDSEASHIIRLHILNYATEWYQILVREAYDNHAPKCYEPLTFGRDDAFNFLMMSECYLLEDSECEEEWLIALRNRCYDFEEDYPDFDREEIIEKGQWVAGWLQDEIWEMYKNM